MLSEVEFQRSPNGRRSFMKLMAAAPLFATMGTRSLAASVAATVTANGKRSFSDNIYTRLGVRPLINGRGTWTYLSGSLELPETRRASEEAAHYFVDIFELQAAAGRQLAKLSGAESGMVTSGATGAIASATAGCIAGTDPKNIWQLPDTTGLKDEVVMLGGRIDFDSAIRLCGAKLVIAPTVDDLQSAITSQTAMVYTTFRDDRLSSALKITRAASAPLLVDDAAGIPPFENFTRFIKLGVDLCCFSGGKGMCGPQSAGLLLGRKDLIDAALANTNPWEEAVCRPIKACNWPLLARQDVKERESSDDGASRPDDSYSPRRHWCSVGSPTEKRGSGVAYRRVMTFVGFRRRSRWEFALCPRPGHATGMIGGANDQEEQKKM